MARKNIFKICFVIAAISALGASYAYAGSGTSISTAISLGGGSFSPSKSVTISVQTGNGTASTCSTASAATDPCNSYSARSKHSSGDRILATTNSDPKTYYSTVTSVNVSIGTASLTENFATGWTAL